MTQAAGEVSAGRLSLEAYVDTTGAARGLQQRINKEVAAVRAKVKVEIDSRGAIGQARAAAAAASKAAIVRVKGEVDARSMVASARRAAAEASAAAIVKVRTSVDQATLASTVAQIEAAVRERTVDVNVDADVAKARAEIAALRREAGRPMNVPVSGGDGGRGARETANQNERVSQTGYRAARSLAMMGATVGGIYALVAAVGQLGGGLLALVSSAASAAGAIAVLPNLVGVAGMAIGTLVAGFSGVGDAVTAIGAAQKQAATVGTAAAGAQTAAADRIAGAQRRLGDARRQAGEQARQAAEAVRDAEWALARSVEGVRDAYEALSDTRRRLREEDEESADRVTAAEEGLSAAQRNQALAQANLTKARVVAKKRIDDLRLSLALARQQERAAMLSLSAAQQNLQDVRWNMGASPQEIAEAEAAVQAAELALASQTAQVGELATENQAANEAGVEGSEEVLDAQEAINRAVEEEKDAREELRDARRDDNRQAVLAARDLRNAEEDVRDAIHAQQEAREALVDAQRAQAQGAADAARAIADAQKGLGAAGAAPAVAMPSAADLALDEAMSNLSPAAQRFAQFLADVVLPRLKEMKFAIQEALLPPIQQGITAAMPFFDTLQTGLVGTAKVLGQFALMIGRILGRDAVNTDIAGIMNVNNKALSIGLRAVKDLFFAFVDLGSVAGKGLLLPMVRSLAEVAQYLREAAREGRESGKLADYFDRVRERGHLLWVIIRSIAHALYGVGTAATGAGDDLLGSLADATERFDRWANSDEGQRKMKEFFDAVVPVTEAFGELAVNVFKLFAALSSNGVGPVAGLLFVLNNVVKALTWLLGVPGLGEFVGWLLTLAGAGMGIGLVALQLSRLGGGLAILARVTGLASLWRMFNATMLASRIQLVLWQAAAKAQIVVANIMRGVMLVGAAAFRIAGMAIRFMMGPWGLLLIAIAAGVIYAYRHFEGFRNVVNAVFGAIRAAISWVIDGFRWLWDVLFGHSIIPDLIAGFQAAWGFIKAVFDAWLNGVKVLGAIFAWLWDNAVKPALGFIIDYVRFMWNEVYKPILGFLWDALKTLGGWFSWLWDNAVKPAWNAIRSAISGAWDFIRPILTNLWGAVQTLGGWFSSLLTTVQGVWEGIKTKIGNVWDGLFGNDGVFTKMKNFLTGEGDNTLPGFFKQAVTKATGWWDDLQEMAAKPVRFMVNTVFNNGILKLINAIPGVDNIDPITLGFKSGGILPGYTPGRDVHTFTSPTGGRIGLSGGEGIIRPEATAVLGAKFVNGINSVAKHGKRAVARYLGWGKDKPGYANGGVLRDLGNFFAGGFMPLPGGSVSSHGSDYPFPAYDMNYPGYADFDKPVYAWKAGSASAHDIGDTSYGRYVTINHDVGSTLYAHLNRFGNLGAVAAGQVIGYVGDYGNTGDPPTSHLHFEIRGAPIDPGDTSVGGKPVNTEGKKQEKSWKDFISGALDTIKAFPGYLSNLTGMGGWGGYIGDMAKSIGNNVSTYINDKIPDKIEISGFPDIPLPANPIPNLFDRGGQWLSGTVGLNMSGQTETVFTNRDMVDLGSALQATAATLRSIITGDGSATVGGVGAPMIGELTLIGREDERQGMLRDVTQTFTVMKLGGVHAARGAAGAST